MIECTNSASGISSWNSACLCEVGERVWKCSLDICSSFVVQALPSQDSDNLKKNNNFYNQTTFSVAVFTAKSSLGFRKKKSLRFVAEQYKAGNNYRKDVVHPFHTTEKFDAW